LPSSITPNATLKPELDLNSFSFKKVI